MRQSLDPSHKWKQQNHLKHLDKRIRIGYRTPHIVSGYPHKEIADRTQSHQQHHEHDQRTDDIEQQMDPGRALRVFISVQADKQRGNTAAHVAAKDQEKADFKGQKPLRRHQDDNAH